MSMRSMPLLSVTVLESQPRQLPFRLSLTTPLSSSNPRYSMSPPSSWIAGRTLVSSSSLIIATTSESVSKMRVSAGPSLLLPSRKSGVPAVKCSMMIE